MSVWIVSKGHIDCLVQALAMERIITFAEADEVGADLWRECHNSVNYRYDESEPTPEYTFNGAEAPLDPFVVYKQVRCYEYQSCEHDAWPESKASDLMKRLAACLLTKLGIPADAVSSDERWGGTPWGIASIEEALARRKAS